jgi:hypothetical protein
MVPVRGTFMSENESKSANLPQRLCSEIQLFDLCDLDSCKEKEGRFCTNHELVGKFEKIAEAELKTPEQYISEELDEDYDDVDGSDYDDELEGDDFEYGEDDDLKEEW